MLASTFTGQNVRGWWMSEKYDGCRAYWDGSVLRTRETWRAIDAPAWFTLGLPVGVALDGELWLGRQTFEECRILVQYGKATDPKWEAARYMVFDCPTTDAVAWEVRNLRAFDWVAASGNHRIEHVRQYPVNSTTTARHYMQEVCDLGGEGIVLRAPGHCYEFNRSRNWLKMKPSGRED